jgi:hypothetical protein
MKFIVSTIRDGIPSDGEISEISQPRQREIFNEDFPILSRAVSNYVNRTGNAILRDRSATCSARLDP